QVEAIGLESLSTTVEELKGLLDDESTIEAIKNAAALKLQVDAIDKYLAGYKDSDKTLQQELEDLKALIGAGDGTISDELVDAIVAKLTESGVGELVTIKQVGALITGITFVKEKEYGEYYYTVGPGVTIPVFEENHLSFPFKNVTSLTDLKFGGEGYADFIQFTKGKVYEGGTKIAVIVKVTPANATLDKNNISLVNSKGEGAINDYVNVIDVQPYKKLLTRADLPSTGLYTVILALNQTTYKEREFNKVTTNGGQIRFALAVEDKDASGASRYVLSDFDATLGVSGGTSIYEVTATTLGNSKFQYTVATDSDPVNVNKIANRHKVQNGNEQAWNNENASKNTDPSKEIGLADFDARSTNAPKSIELGKPFKVAPTANLTGALAYYIDLDTKNLTTGDNDAEKKLWEEVKSKATGLKQVYSISDVAEITIPVVDTFKGKVIGFRVYAVNYDGTLVDPDGRAFYVVCGDTPAQGEALNFETNITYYVGGSGSSVSTNTLVVKIPEGYNGTQLSASFSVTFEDDATDGGEIGTYRVTNNQLSVSVWARPYYMQDDGRNYDGTLNFYDSKNIKIITYPIKVKKVLPNTLPTRIERFTQNDVSWSNSYSSTDGWGGILDPTTNTAENITDGTIAGYDPRVKLVSSTTTTRHKALLLTTAEIVGNIYQGTFNTNTSSLTFKQALVHSADDNINIIINKGAGGITEKDGVITVPAADIAANREFAAQVEYNYGFVYYEDSGKELKVTSDDRDFVVEFEVPQDVFKDYVFDVADGTSYPVIITKSSSVLPGDGAPITYYLNIPLTLENEKTAPDNPIPVTESVLNALLAGGKSGFKAAFWTTTGVSEKLVDLTIEKFENLDPKPSATNTAIPYAVLKISDWSKISGLVTGSDLEVSGKLELRVSLNDVFGTTHWSSARIIPLTDYPDIAIVP
ncbi:hypothetical protein EZS27_027811, partial [termite gut metagenome]